MEEPFNQIYVPAQEAFDEAYAQLSYFTSPRAVVSEKTQLGEQHTQDEAIMAITAYDDEQSKVSMAALDLRAEDMAYTLLNQLFCGYAQTRYADDRPVYAAITAANQAISRYAVNLCRRYNIAPLENERAIEDYYWDIIAEPGKPFLIRERQPAGKELHFLWPPPIRTSHTSSN